MKDKNTRELFKYLSLPSGNVFCATVLLFPAAFFLAIMLFSGNVNIVVMLLSAIFLVFGVDIALCVHRDSKAKHAWFDALSTAELQALMVEFHTAKAVDFKDTYPFPRENVRIGHTHIFTRNGGTPCAIADVKSLRLISVSMGDDDDYWALDYEDRDGRVRRIGHVANHSRIKFDETDRVLLFNDLPLLQQSIHGGEFVKLPDPPEKPGLFARADRTQAFEDRDTLLPVLNALLAVRPDLTLTN